MTPFAAGIALGYLLDPVVRRLERIGLSRLAASLLILAAFVLVAVLFLVVVAPILGNQLIGFTQKLPGYVMRLQALAVDEGNALLERYGGEWRNSLGLGNPLSAEQIQKSIGDFVAQGAQWLLNAVRSLASGGAAIVSFFSFLIVTPVVAFYILVDWNRMIATLDGWLPLDHRDALRAIASEIDAALAGFIRGQSLVCLFLGLWYGIGLTLIGLDFGFLIGVIAGVLSFIPYVGSLTALVLSLGVGLVQGWPSLKLFFLALAVVGVGQFLEGNVIAPKLVGGSIGLHPVWLMFALFAFGELFGFTGLLIAVPTAAALGVLARHLIGLYLKSPLYRGAAPRGSRVVSGPARQLTLDWPHDPSYAREDFLEAPGNAEALRAILSWPNWAGRMLMLVGPERLGQEPSRRDLGAQARRRASSPPRRCRARRWSNSPPPNALLIEDADRIGAARGRAVPPLEPDARKRRALAPHRARASPTRWGLKTADLLSRLRLAPIVSLGAPDLDLTQAVLFKLFSDRQLAVDPSVVSYVALRIERSLDAARAIVAALDREALARGKRVTRAMAAEFLRDEPPAD